MMWIPTNIQEIIDAIAAGQLQEGPTFDAKKELGNNSKEIAKDIAAMANNGGVLIYGIDEDEHGHLTIAAPIPVDGAAEKIDQIAATCISEMPRIQTLVFRKEDDPSIGFLVVVIPPSERAPHMVVVGKDNRYYQRYDKTSVRMTEGEVARLYERRRRWEVDRNALVRELLEEDPFPPHNDLAYLRAFARPVNGQASLLSGIGEDRTQQLNALREMISIAGKREVYPHLGSPRFDDIRHVMRPTIDGYMLQSDDPIVTASLEQQQVARRYVQLRLASSGYSKYFCGRVADLASEGKHFYPSLVVSHVLRFLCFMGCLYDRSRYLGMVDVGIAITGIKGLTVQSDFRRFIPFGGDQYVKTARLSAPTFANVEGARNLAAELIMPLMDEMTEGIYDPFTAP